MEASGSQRRPSTTQFTISTSSKLEEPDGIFSVSFSELRNNPNYSYLRHGFDGEQDFEDFKQDLRDFRRIKQELAANNPESERVIKQELAANNPQSERVVEVSSSKGSCDFSRVESYPSGIQRPLTKSENTTGIKKSFSKSENTTGIHKSLPKSENTFVDNRDLEQGFDRAINVPICNSYRDLKHGFDREINVPICNSYRDLEEECNREIQVPIYNYNRELDQESNRVIKIPVNNNYNRDLDEESNREINVPIYNYNRDLEQEINRKIPVPVYKDSNFSYTESNTTGIPKPLPKSESTFRNYRDCYKELPVCHVSNGIAANIRDSRYNPDTVSKSDIGLSNGKDYTDVADYSQLSTKSYPSYSGLKPKFSQSTNPRPSPQFTRKFGGSVVNGANYHIPHIIRHDPNSNQGNSFSIPSLTTPNKQYLQTDDENRFVDSQQSEKNCLLENQNTIVNSQSNFNPSSKNLPLEENNGIVISQSNFNSSLKNSPRELKNRNSSPKISPSEQKNSIVNSQHKCKPSLIITPPEDENVIVNSQRKRNPSPQDHKNLRSIVSTETKSDLRTNLSQCKFSSLARRRLKEDFQDFKLSGLSGLLSRRRRDKSIMEPYSFDEHYQEFERVYETIHSRRSSVGPDMFQHPLDDEDEEEDEGIPARARGLSRFSSKSSLDDVFSIDFDDAFLDFFNTDEDFVEFEREFENSRLNRRSRGDFKRLSSCDIFSDVKSFCDRNKMLAATSRDDLRDTSPSNGLDVGQSSRARLGGYYNNLGEGQSSHVNTGTGYASDLDKGQNSHARTGESCASHFDKGQSSHTGSGVVEGETRGDNSDSDSSNMWNSLEEWDYVLNKLKRNSRMFTDSAEYWDVGEGATSLSDRFTAESCMCKSSKDCQYTCHHTCIPSVTLDCTSISPTEVPTTPGGAAAETSLSHRHRDVPTRPQIPPILNQQSGESEATTPLLPPALESEPSHDPAHENDETDSGYRSGTIPDEKLPKHKGEATLNREELKRKVDAYNLHVPSANFEPDEGGETFQGFLKVTLNFIRPITMSLGVRPPSIYEMLTKEHIVEQNTQSIAFYMPRDTVKSIHTSSAATTKEVIAALLKKFHIIDHPRKFAMYEQEFDGHKIVKLRRVQDKEYPLAICLDWDTEHLKRYRLVIQENETGEIVWDGFSLPELKNFLTVLGREENEYISQLQYKYKIMRRIITQRLKELRKERRAKLGGATSPTGSSSPSSPRSSTGFSPLGQNSPASSSPGSSKS